MSSAPKFTRPTVPELDLKSGIQRPRLLTYHESKSARLEREALKVKKENTQREALRLSLAVTISKKQATRAPKSSKKKGKKGKSVKIVEKVKPEMLSPRITKVVPFRDPGEKKKPMSYNMLERLPGFRKSTDEGIDAILAPDSPIGSPIGTPKRGIHKFYPRGSNRAIHLSKKKKGEEAMIKRSKAGALNLQHKMMGDNYVYAAVKAIILELQRDETDLFNVMYRTPSEIELDNIRMYDSAEDSSDEDEFGSSNAVSPLLGGASTNNTKGVISTKKITPKMILKGDSTMIPESTKYNNNTERFMVREVNLRDNRMTDRGICRVLHDICKCAEITDNISLLDLSENHMRKSSADVLGQVLIKCCNLEKLVLEKAEISNIVMKAMQVGLTEGANTCLLHLNLSRNEILDAGCIIIADILANEDCQLRELDLSWNKIQDKGAVAIFTALMTNKQILKLDVSWNAIGTKTEKTFSVSTALSDMLLNNSSLIHLDLSQNQLSVQDCTIISEGLKQNHSLLGFHMTGNQAQIDTYGYLMPEASPWPLESGHVMSRIIHSKVTGQEKWILRNNCWICGYYREHEFKYVLTLRGIDEIMHAIMNDTAQLAVFEAKRKAMAAKEEAESKKQAAAEAQADPFAAMFASVSIDSQEAQKNANQAKEEEALQAQYAYPTLPSMPLFVDCSVKLCTSFDQWVPEEMVSLRINTQVINAATNMGNIRKSNSPTATMNAQNATGGYTIKTALENKTLYGEDFNRYPYAMKLMDMYRVEASEEDAKAIALDSLQFSLRTRRREHSAATSATSSHHASLREVDGMDAVGINGAGEMEGTTTTTATDDDNNNNNNDDDDGETAVEGGYCVEIVDGIGNVEEMEVTLSTSAEGEGEIEGEREEQSDANFNKHEEEQEEVEVHRLYGLDEKDNDEYRSDPSRPHFNLHRMVPPGVHYFGFRINNGALQFDPFQPHVRTSTLMKLGLSFPKELLELGLPQFLNTTTVHPLSKAEKLRGPPAMYTDIKPRIKNDDMADAKKYWTFNDSLFFNNNAQHQEAWQNRCFAKDWGYTKISKGRSTNEVNALEILLRKHFQLLKNVFSHYSCLYSSEIFFMAQGAYNEFNTSCQILEVVETSSGQAQVKKDEAKGPVPPSISKRSSKTPSLRSVKGSSFKNADNSINDIGVIDIGESVEEVEDVNTSTSLLQESIESITPGPSKASAISGNSKPGATRTELELIFVGACITGPRHEYNSKRALTRFQFLDALVQIANVKFVKTGLVSNLVDAVEKLIVEHIEPYAERDDPDEFRSKFLYTESCDDALRKNYTKFEKIFDIFSGEENTPLEPKSMSFREWVGFCDRGALAEELLAERMMKLSYVRSKFCYADVFDESNAFKQMTLLEFLEAVVRCALSMHKANVQQQLQLAEENMLLDHSNSLTDSVEGGVPADLGLNSLSTLSAEGIIGNNNDSNSLKSKLEVASVKEFAYVIDSIASKRYIQGKATKQKK